MRNAIEQHIRIDVVSLAILDSIDLAMVNRRDMKAHLITRINVPAQHRNQGYGRKLLKAACDAADTDGITLFIEAMPYADSPLDTEALTCWYERCGFSPFAGILRRLPVKKE